MRAALSTLLILLPFLAGAEVVVPIDSVEQHVNVRMSPEAGAEIVGRLRQGESMPFVESQEGWHEVEIAGGATGFISADWTKVVDEAPEQSADAADETEDTEETPTVAAETRDEAAAEEPDDSVVTNSIAKESLAVPAEIGVAEKPPAEAGSQVADGELESKGDTQSHGAAEESVVSEESEAAVETSAADADAQVEEAAEEAVADHVEEPTDKVDSVVEKEPVTEEELVADEEPVTEEVPAENEAVAKAEQTSADVESAVNVVRGPRGERGPPGPPGPPGGGGGSSIEGTPDYLVKFAAPTVGGNSQLYDDGNNVGIGTTEPKQRLEVNGNIQIHERNSSVAGLMITQSSGDTGYIMHNMASTLTIGAGSIDRITINRDGLVGIGVSRPAHPLELASGAYASAGGVWTNSSSRARKENINDLDVEEALRTLAALEPVEFNYKNDQQEKYVGFIAEDVPDLVATADRQSLSTMDIVAVLTKVVQQQQEKIAELEARLDQR